MRDFSPISLTHCSIKNEIMHVPKSIPVPMRTFCVMLDMKLNASKVFS